MSGMYDLAPVRLSWRRTYVSFTDEMVNAMSSQRHIDKLHAAVKTRGRIRADSAKWAKVIHDAGIKAE
jgi:hypothetical protein